MTPHLHFTLKISADLFGSLESKLSAQPSFENFLRIRAQVSPFLSLKATSRLYIR
jgi:hypothetical protein